MELDLETRVLNTRKELETARELKVRYEERLANATKQKAELEAQLKAVGIDPSKLDQIIEDKKNDLELKVTEFESNVAKVAESLKQIQEKLGD